MKRFGSLLLALAMCAALALPAFAEGDDNVPQRGTVTINNAEPGKAYKFYRLLEPDDNGGYRLTDEWVESSGGPEYNYIKIEGSKVFYANEYQHPDKGWTEIKESDHVSVGKLLAHVRGGEYRPKPIQEVSVSDETNGTVSSSLPCGYYLVDYDDGTGGLFYLDSTGRTIEKKTQSDPDIQKKSSSQTGIW